MASMAQNNLNNDLTGSSNSLDEYLKLHKEAKMTT